PETHVGFLRVEASAGNLDFDAIPRVQVRIGYDDDPNAFHVEDTFILSKDKPTFTWLVRLSDPALATYWYEVTYFLKDNQTIPMPRQTSIGRSLVINQPWQDQMVLHVDADMLETAHRLVVEIAYEDTDAGYRFSHVKRILAAADVPENVTLPLLDRNKRTY